MAAIIAVALLIAAGCVFGGWYFMHSKQEHEQALLAAQAEAEAAQQAAEQAQAEAEAARAEQEKAQADAAQAQADAEKAQAEADQAKSDAAAQAAIILAAITAAQNDTAISFDGYIFPSDRQYITASDMAYWDQTIALLARNEIYARHGYIFQTDYIQEYFSAQSWYRPDPDYKGAGLSRVEQANVDTILEYEKQMGWQ